MANDTTEKAQRAAQWALAAVRPDYFSWPTDAQERYRESHPWEDQRRIEEALYLELFGLKVNIPPVTAEGSSNSGISLPLEDQLLMKHAELLTRGFGENSFWSLDLQNGTWRSLLDFDTLHDCDFAQYEKKLQDAATSPGGRSAERETWENRPYRGVLRAEYAHLQIDGRFSHADLSMAAVYIHARLEEIGRSRIYELNDPQITRGVHNGGISKGQGQRNLNAINNTFDDYASRRWRALEIEFDQNPRGCVYLMPRELDGEPELDFIFSDQTALRRVRFRSFMRDCRSIEREASELNGILETERAAAMTFIHEAYAELLKNPPIGSARRAIPHPVRKVQRPGRRKSPSDRVM